MKKHMKLSGFGDFREIFYLNLDFVHHYNHSYRFWT